MQPNWKRIMTEVRTRQLIGGQHSHWSRDAATKKQVWQGEEGRGGGGGGAPKMGPSSKPAKQAGMVVGARAGLRLPSESADLRRCGTST